MTTPSTKRRAGKGSKEMALSGRVKGHDARGRFNSESKGRVKGSHNKVTLIRLSLFDGRAKDLAEKAIAMALSGDVTALRLCLERIAPVHKATVKPVKLPKLAEAVGFEAKAEAVLDAVAGGLLAPDVGTALVDAIARLLRGNASGAGMDREVVIRDETSDAEGRWRGCDLPSAS